MDGLERRRPLARDCSLTGARAPGARSDRTLLDRFFDRARALRDRTGRWPAIRDRRCSSRSSRAIVDEFRASPESPPRRTVAASAREPSRLAANGSDTSMRGTIPQDARSARRSRGNAVTCHEWQRSPDAQTSRRLENHRRIAAALAKVRTEQQVRTTNQLNVAHVLSTSRFANVR